MTAHASAADIRRKVARGFRPGHRCTVSESAERSMRIDSAGGYIGPWDRALVPYLVEPMDALTRRDAEAVIVVMPARAGKSCALLDGWLVHAVTADPGNMLQIHTAQDLARNYSKSQFASLATKSPDIRRLMSKRARDDNMHDKYFVSGMWLNIGWPSETQLASRTYRYVAITDLDRLQIKPEKLSGVFDKARKRTQTFLSAGMTLVESSPGHDVFGSSWIPETEHEAPPCYGIMELFNRGSRHCYYWECPECRELFQPRFSLLQFDRTPDADPGLASQDTKMGCPHCGALLGPEQKRPLNATGVWLSESDITGRPRATRILSYWGFGPMAAYQSWSSLAYNHLVAAQAYDRTGNEDPLRQTTRQDQGEPYAPKRVSDAAQPTFFEDQAQPLEKRHVPDGVRYLTCAVDVQHSRFVVQVEGWGPDHRYIIDRLSIRHSARQGADGKPEPVQPGAYLEDWEPLIQYCVEKRYPLAENPAVSMPIMLTLCDSGGAAGVTSMAYDFWRHLRKMRLHRRFFLVKGDGALNAPRVKLSYPDTQRKERSAKARGEIPVQRLNVNLLKDELHQQFAARHVVFPDWLHPSFYRELSSETRNEKTRRWELVDHRAHNEALDLMAYNRAAAIILGADKIDWAKPPGWARPWHENLEVIGKPAPTHKDRSAKSAPLRTPWMSKFYDS